MRWDGLSTGVKCCVKRMVIDVSEKLAETCVSRFGCARPLGGNSISTD